MPPSIQIDISLNITMKASPVKERPAHGATLGRKLLVRHTGGLFLQPCDDWPKFDDCVLHASRNG